MKINRCFLLLPALLLAPALPNAELFPAPRPVLAAEENPTSPLTDIIVPAAPDALPEAAPFFTSLLKALGEHDGIDMIPASQDVAEVWAWAGEAGSADRAASTRDRVQAALRAGDFVVAELSEKRAPKLDISQYFGDGTAFRPAEGQTPIYFLANNPGRHQMILGAWLQSEDGLAVAMLPMKFRPREN